MEAGRITQSGTYAALLQAGTTFENLVNAHHSALAVLDAVGPTKPAFPAQKTVTVGTVSLMPVSDKQISKSQLTSEEEKEIGNLGWEPYSDYISVSGASLLLGLVVLCQSGFVIFQAISTFWLAMAVEIPEIGEKKLIGIYAVFSTLSGVSAYMRSYLGAKLGLKASAAFFSGFMNCLFRAPMQFFDATPVGRILTRVRLLPWLLSEGE